MEGTGLGAIVTQTEVPQIKKIVNIYRLTTLAEDDCTTPSDPCPDFCGCDQFCSIVHNYSHNTYSDN